ncbi:MAG: hypothetical protein KIT17_01225 [Rubrivivax sp.]|nr:hypothetical protein [Rubrivivax sp.]
MPDEHEPNLRKTTADIRAELDAFTGADWARLRTIASVKALGLVGWAWNDLLQEAMTKMLAGERTCLVGVHPVTMLAKVMHSIASNERESDQASPFEQDEVDHVDKLERESGAPAVAGTAVADLLTQVAVFETAAAMDKAFAGDEEIQLLATAWAMGLRGGEAAKELGWDQKRFEAVRQRFLRRIRDFRPDWSDKDDDA